MKTKIIIVVSCVLIVLFGFFYIQNNNLIADDKDGKKNCSSTCTKDASMTQHKGCEGYKTSSASDDPNNTYARYEFVTDKITCDGCKKTMSGNLMGIAGVKEVKYGETCKVSQMTNVEVYYSSEEVAPEVLAASVKDKGLECDKSKCGDKNKVDSKSKEEKKL